VSDYDITTLILAEHEAFRRQFAALSDLTDSTELAGRWTDLAERLEVHASGEEAVFYPRLLHEIPDEEADTVHAVRDHNKIRHAVAAVAGHETGSDSWWQAVRDAQEENSEHMEEEEADLLTVFRDEAGAALRQEIGLAWLQFHEEHEHAAGLSGRPKDPEAYVDGVVATIASEAP